MVLKLNIIGEEKQMGILSDMGIADNLYKKEEKKPDKNEKVTAPKEKEPGSELDYVFEKNYECVCCGHNFKEMTVKTSRARIIKTDWDLRPVFSGIDTIKYDVISCPSCGYSATTKFYGVLAAPQKKLIQTNVGRNFIRFSRNKIVSYDEAIERYKLALGCSIVKKAKDSEKAYTCLRMAWVIRGKAENLDRTDPEYENNLKMLKEDEDELLHNALEGFVSARRTEHFPIAGMDELTLDYLLSVLFYNEGDLNSSAKLCAQVLTSKAANNRIKDKARDLKDAIIEKRKNQ